MNKPTRRQFFHRGAAGIAATTWLAAGPRVLAADSPRVRVATIGCGGQGMAHIRSLKTLKDAELVYVCDVDESRLAKAVSESGGAQSVSDLRRILDDRTIDAVTIATPDHWHAPAALLAMQAGKHVYVEKPCCHNVREGQWLVETARAHNRVVQHGTQSRSAVGIREAIDMLHEGAIGKVLTATCWNWQRRANIGHASPSAPPAGIDYDTWVGPAEMMPFQPNRFHYTWHWWYNFGCGDMGNDGIHELDLALWGLNVQTHPTTIAAIGGKYYFDDDQQFPDTQQVTFEYPGDGSVGARRMLVYEQRIWSTNAPFNVDGGIEFFGTEGRLLLSKRGKVEFLGDRNQKLNVKVPQDLTLRVADHQQNWIDCIRSGRRPNADVEIAHRAATAVHLGNLATRLGRSLRFDPDTQRILDDQSQSLLKRTYRDGGHWSVPQSA